MNDDTTADIDAADRLIDSILHVLGVSDPNRVRCVVAPEDAPADAAVDSFALTANLLRWHWGDGLAPLVLPLRRILTAAAGIESACVVWLRRDTDSSRDVPFDRHHLLMLVDTASGRRVAGGSHYAFSGEQLSHRLLEGYLARELVARRRFRHHVEEIAARSAAGPAAGRAAGMPLDVVGDLLEDTGDMEQVSRVREIVRDRGTGYNPMAWGDDALRSMLWFLGRTALRDECDDRAERAEIAGNTKNATARGRT